LADLDYTVFDKARAEIMELMRSDSFVRFKRTEAYRLLEEKHAQVKRETEVLASLVR
jgi:hypothetical protein